MPQPSVPESNSTLKAPSLHVPRVVSRRNRFTPLNSNIESPMDISTASISTSAKEVDSTNYIVNLKATDVFKNHISYLKVSTIPKKDLSLDEVLLSDSKKTVHTEQNALPVLFKNSNRLLKKRNASVQIKSRCSPSKQVQSENNSFEVSKHLECHGEMYKKLPKIVVYKNICNESISDSLLDTTQRDPIDLSPPPKPILDQEKGYLNVKGVRMKCLNLAAAAEKNSPITTVPLTQYPIKVAPKEIAKPKASKEAIKIKVKDTFPQRKIFDYGKFQLMPRKQLVNLYELVKRLNENKLRVY